MSLPTPQLSIRTLLEITAAVAVVLAFYFTRPTPVLPPQLPPIGRYILFQQASQQVRLLDSQTGQCWSKSSDGYWYANMELVSKAK